MYRYNLSWLTVVELTIVRALVKENKQNLSFENLFKKNKQKQVCVKTCKTKTPIYLYLGTLKTIKYRNNGNRKGQY